MKGQFWQTDGMSGSRDRPGMTGFSAAAEHIDF
jgi:hypothetical protein